MFRWNKLLLIPLLLGAILVWLLWPQSSAVAGWFDDNWLYRVAISIGNTGSADANKKVKFDIDTATLIAAGKMQSDCGDSRFTDAGGKILKYYLDGAGGACNGASTDYYVLMESIPVGGSIIYHYYGNPSVQNGTQSSQFSQSTFAPNSGPTAASEEKSPGPVAAWSFDEGTGTTTYDATENNNDGTITNAVWKQESDCISGKCLWFDGTGDYTQVTDSNSLDIANTITVSAWVKPNLINGTRQDIITKASAFEFRMHTDNTFRVKFFNLSDDFLTGTMPTLVAGEWVHLAATYDGTNISAYVNGKLILQDDSSGSITTNASNVIIGAESASATTPFKGFIDEARVYPYARSANQIKSDYTSRGDVNGAAAQFGAGGPGSGEKLSQGLVGYWKMDESAANGCSGGTNDSCDSSGNSNDGAWSGDVAATAGKFSNGTTYDGTGDYITVTNHASLNPTSAITLSAWVYLNYTSAAHYIITKATTDQYYLRTNNTGKVRLSINSTTFDGNATLSTSTWYHLVGVYDGKRQYIYINGVLDASQALTATMADNGTNVEIGNGGLPMSGKLDEARIYNRALSPAEVAALYNFAPGPVGYWKFDERTGSTNIYDSSGNANTGTMTSMESTDWTAGKFGSALVFDGTNENIDAGSAANLDNLPTLTASAWINPQDTGGGYPMILGKVYGPGWLLYLDGGQKKFNFFSQFAGTDLTCSTGINAFSFGVWVHVAVAWDGTSTCSGAKLYLNGILTDWISTTSGTLTRDDDDASTLNIGGHSSLWYFKGIIDDAKVYNYTRTASQIIEDMSAKGGSTLGGNGSQAAYWKFDEGYGDTAYNSISSSNNGDLAASGTTCPQAGDSACPTWTNAGKFGKALDFDNSATTDDYIDVGNIGITSYPFTMSGWIKNGTGSGTVIALTNSAVSTVEYLIGFSGGANPPPFMRARNTTPVDITDNSTNANDGNWHHLVGVFASATDRKFYVDGKLAGTDTTSVTLSASATTWNIGRTGRATPAFYTDGIIDEVKVYAAELTLEQVLIDYNQGKSTVMGSASTASNGITGDNSSTRAYCVPGDTSTCNSPVAEWKLNEGTLTTANDTSGNANTGTLANGPTWTKGKIGQAVEFDGTNDQITVSDSTSLDVGPTATWTMWLKLNTLPSVTGNTFNVLDKWIGTGNQRSYQLQITTTNNKPHMSIDPDGLGVSGVDIASDNGFATNTWYHLAAVADGTSAYMYINGTKQADIEALTSIYSSTAGLILGSDTSSNYFDGVLDDVRIYNYVRTPAQIAWEYNKGAPVAWYKFDECQGTTLNDWAPNSSGGFNGNNGAITIGATGSNTSAGTCTGSAGEAWKDGETGKINASLEFDGTDDYIIVSSPSNMTITSSYTTSLWFKANSWPAASNYRTLMTSHTGSAAPYYMEINSVDELNCGFHNGSDYVDHDSGNANLSSSIWYHFACVFDDTTNRFKIYINGKEFYSASEASAPSGTVTSFQIGRVPSAQYYSGQLDDIRIYNYALSPAQVKTVMNNGAVSFK